MIQNLAWATGYNVVALPLAAGVLYRGYNIVLDPALGAVLNVFEYSDMRSELTITQN
ncbi:MAG: hypothetical protein JSS07_12440 [Proteobacteria bacterium]|nr:hypothetical protein [Pseudomonadota bacterium]